MSSNEPKDPNAPSPVDTEAAVAAAEAALAQARAAAEAASAARARAEALSRSSARPTPVAATSRADSSEVFYTTGGEERRLVDASARFKISRLAIGVGLGVLLLALGGFAMIAMNPEAKARMDKAFAGNSCGADGKQSCLTDHVLGPKFALERQWREEDAKAKPIHGTLSLNYEPQDATVEIFQIKYKLTGDEWRRGKGGLGTKICEKNADGTEKCEFPYKVRDGIENGACTAEKPETDVASITGRQLESLRLTFIPVFDTVRNCAGESPTGEVTEAYNYEYRLVFSHKDFESKSVYLSKSAWSIGIGSAILEWPGLALVPKPETMLEQFVKFRTELFCYMKKRTLTADKVPASVVDALRQQNGFVTIELYDKTETLVLSPEKKAWWDEKWKEIEALKCEE
jgi:hypothetical protein